MNAGAGNQQQPSQSGSHPSGSQESPLGSAALNGKKDKYQTFVLSDSHPDGFEQSPPGSPVRNEKNDKYKMTSFSDKEDETDVDEQVQLIESDHRLGGGRVTVVEETSKDSDLQSGVENVCNNSVFSIIINPRCMHVGYSRFVCLSACLSVCLSVHACYCAICCMPHLFIESQSAIWLSVLNSFGDDHLCLLCFLTDSQWTKKKERWRSFFKKISVYL